MYRIFRIIAHISLLMEPKKSPEADLEKKKGLFFQIGLLFSLAAVFIAFEWKTYETKLEGFGPLDVGAIDEELPPITQQELKPPPPPPPPVVELEIVEDDVEIEEEVEILESEADQQTVVADIPVFQEEVIEEPEIFTIVEEMPSFPGGDEGLIKYLNSNIKYPPMAKDAGIQGVVYVTFVIGPDGKVKDAKILRGVRGLDDEALRVVKAMPSWKPGKQRGKSVSVQYNLPIRFTLR